MKLTNIRIYNSKNYHKANLVLDVDSVQIAGGNNRGKTSLLWTLMFLFVVHRKKAAHPNYGEKESLQFYFPGDKSYIVYEGFDEMQGYYYLLLHRNGDKIEYYFAKKRFKEEFLVQNKSVLSFDKVLENPETGLKKKDASVAETIARNIQKKKDRIGFIRLNPGIKSEMFSDLYRHLFRVTKSDNNILKNGILIALGYQDEVLDFGRLVPTEDRIRWKRDHREIEELKKIAEVLSSLKEEKERYDSAELKLKMVISEFDDINFELVLSKAKEAISRFKILMENNEERLNNEIYDHKSFLSTSKDGALKAVGIAESEFRSIKKRLEDANSYGEPVWVKQEIANLEKQSQSLKTLIEKIVLTEDPVRLGQKLMKLESREKQISGMLKEGSDSLILNFSDNADIVSIANAVLSDEVKSLPSDKMSEWDEIDPNALILKGRKIDISGISPSPAPTKEDLEHELRDVVKEKIGVAEVIENLNKRKQLEEDLEKVTKDLFDAQGKLKEINSVPQYKIEMAGKKEILEKAVDKELELGKRLKDLETEEKELRTSVTNLKDEISKTGRKQDDIVGFSLRRIEAEKKIDMARKDRFFKDYTLNETHDAVKKGYPRLEEAFNEFAETDAAFSGIVKNVILTNKTLESLHYENIEELIVILEEKCYKVEVLEANLNDNIKMSFGLIAQGIKNFLEKIDHAAKSVSKMNSMISNYTISDLTNVKVILNKNEKQINDLNVADPSENDIFSEIAEYEDASKSSGSLGKHIRLGKVLPLSDLFTIEVEREKNNKKEESQQSNGTERMLHVMLLLMTMREMVHEDDTIPFLIDEVADIDSKNQTELLSFFKSSKLLPISASPQVAPEFDKVFHIEEYLGKSYLSDKTATWKERGKANG